MDSPSTVVDIQILINLARLSKSGKEQDHTTNVVKKRHNWDFSKQKNTAAIALFHRSVDNGNSTHYHTNQLMSATPHITNHKDQLMSATPHITNITPGAKTCQKPHGTIDHPPSHPLDNQPP
uniref:Uncharacterized protein n=1 Tax=Romanomermis culicivorax TaxID=13658 RepID=A0A915KF26_ROMCU